MTDFYTENMRLLIEKYVLERPLDHSWSLQGFGMLRMYLSPEVRLHVWDSRYRTTNVSDIHDHPWDFTSTVLWGKMVNMRYFETLGTRYTRYTHHSGQIVCGPNPSVSGPVDIKRVRLGMDMPCAYEPGFSYTQLAGDLHSSSPVDGTVTICRRTPAFGRSSEHARVYWPLGTDWVSAEPRPATNDEVLDILGRIAR